MNTLNTNDVTIPHFHMEKILKSKIVNNELVSQHLNVYEPEISLYKETTPPKIKIIFYRLESKNISTDSDKVAFPINDNSCIEMVIQRENNTPQNFKLIPIKTAYLWDLSKFDKVDVLKCGRFKRNDFLPIINEEPIEMDLGVSREHSIIGLFKNKLYYIDLGTSKKYITDNDIIGQEVNDTHFGSKNGSWLYKNFQIEKCIKNECTEWENNDIIGIGTFFYNVSYKENKLKLFHQFSFQYEQIN